MPILRTPIPDESPGHYGEVAAFRRLAAISLDDLELWFGLHLPQTPEIDVIINHPSVGAYIVEIKAFKLEEIESYTPDRLVRTDGKTSQHPVKQVKSGDYGLRNYLRIHSGNIRVPFFQKSVLWPKITRAEWLTRFNNPVVRDHADFMLFSDDLENPGTFLQALQQITATPLGIPIPPGVRCDQPGIEVLRRLTDYANESHPTPSPEVEEIDVLTYQEKVDLGSQSLKSQDRINKYPPHETHLVALRGFPGSGKTTALRDIAVFHAEAGNSVLYVSYNKILAAKVRQEIGEMLRMRGMNDGLVTVADQYQLIGEAFPGINKAPNARSKWIEQAQKIATEIDLIKFDTILVDEAQDTDGEFFQLLELLKTPKTSVFFAFGDKQQLYNLDRYPNGRSPELEAMIADADVSQFNRVFRNSPTHQLICNAVADYFPNIDAGSNWLKEKASHGKSAPDTGVMSLEFDNFQVEPHIVTVDRDPEVTEKSTLNSLVQHLIDESSNQFGEVNGLIVMGGSGSASYKAVKAYLEVLEIPFADLIADGNRREVPAKNAVILTTYNGARGLTSQHTLVLDASYIETHYNSPSKPTPNNLFNIALSRARMTSVVYSGTTHEDPTRPKLCDFIDQGMLALQG